MAKKNKNKKKKNKVKHSENQLRIFFIWALSIWVFILPLLVHFVPVGVPLQVQKLYSMQTAVDIFTFWKALWLWSGAVIFFACALIFRYIDKMTFKPRKFEIGLIVFAIIIILSFALSKYKNVAWVGYLDRYEGTLSWLAYCLLAYAVATFVNSKKHINIILNAVVFSAGVVGLIGAFQYLGKDFFKTAFGKRILLGSLYEAYAAGLSFEFPVGMTYSTLYNPNYVGSYVAFVLPLIVYLFKANKQIILRIAYAFIALTLFASLIGSRSDGGMIAVGFIIVFLILDYLLKVVPLFNENKIVTIGIALSVIVVAGVFVVSLPQVKAVFSSQTNNHIGIESANLENDTVNVKIVNGDIISLQSRSTDAVIKYNGEVVTPINSNLQEENYIVNSGEYQYLIQSTLDQAGLAKTIVISLNDKSSPNLMKLWHSSGRFYIGKTELKKSDFEVKSINVFSNEVALSFRGYIWNRLLAVIAKKPFLGYGADTFALVFPQLDPVGRIGTYDNNPLMIVDKSHNLFLQLLVNFGVLGLGAYFYVISHVLKSKNICFILSILGVLITGIVNDSIIAISGIMFVILAMSIVKEEPEH